MPINTTSVRSAGGAFKRSAGGVFTRLNTNIGFEGIVTIVYGIAVADTDDFYAAGTFASFRGRRSPSIIRMRSAYSQYISFVSGYDPAPTAYVTLYGVKRGSDTSLFVFGSSGYSYSGSPGYRVIKIDAGGTYIPAFSSRISSGSVLAMEIVGTTSVYVAGSFSSAGGAAANKIARLNYTDGDLDTAFAIGAGFNGNVTSLQLDSSYLYCVGGFTDFNGASCGYICRLNFNGAIDSGYITGVGFDDAVQKCELQSDGALLCLGIFGKYNGVNIRRLARIDSSGVLDATFNSNIPTEAGTDSTWSSIAIQSDQKILIGRTGAGNEKVVRLNTDGTHDTSFTCDSRLTSGVGTVYSITELSNGNIVVTGVFAPIIYESPYDCVFVLDSSGNLI